MLNKALLLCGGSTSRSVAFEFVYSEEDPKGITLSFAVARKTPTAYWKRRIELSLTHKATFSFSDPDGDHWEPADDAAGGLLKDWDLAISGSPTRVEADGAVVYRGPEGVAYPIPEGAKVITIYYS